MLESSGLHVCSSSNRPNECYDGDASRVEKVQSKIKQSKQNSKKARATEMLNNFYADAATTYFPQIIISSCMHSAMTRCTTAVGAY